MLGKLAVSGIKSKLKDYIVLLAGLTMSISIFYMFQTLAWNKDFTAENSLISSIQLVFNVGSFLLAAVTFFYILYTNSFLLSLRQKEFGMYMLLGAKKSQIQRIMFIETMILGFISLIIGIGLGIGLAEVVGRLLMDQLDMTSTTYASFFLPAVGITLAFYFVLFLINGIVNTIRLSRLQILELVHADLAIDIVPTQIKSRIISAILGIIFLGIGYFALIYMEKLREAGLITAPFATTLGTYLIFASLIPFIIGRLKKNRKLNEKGIQSFTFAQLRFRINGLKNMLATVTMLIALGAGAIAAGMAFQHNVSAMVDLMDPYDTIVYDANEEQQEILNGIEFNETFEYRYKVDEQYVYFLKGDLANQVPLVYDEESMMEREPKLIRIEAELPADTREMKEEEIPSNYDWNYFLFRISEPNQAEFGEVVLDAEDFSEIDEAEKTVFIGRTDEFMDYLPKWEQLDNIQNERYDSETLYSGMSKYASYEAYHTLSSGTVFMGFFLGIAFLAMMASCLMFKVLSGATKDIGRYQMLRKIGVRQSRLSGSVYKEIFFIFLFPGIFGLIHVLVGMNLFSFILLEPYYRIWVPILLFIGIYAVYYLITVNLYKGIVMPRED